MLVRAPSTRYRAHSKARPSGRPVGDRMVATSDFSGLVSSACALASAVAEAVWDGMTSASERDRDDALLRRWLDGGSRLDGILLVLSDRRLAGCRQLRAMFDHAFVASLRIPDHGAAKLLSVGPAGFTNRRTGRRSDGQGGRHQQDDDHNSSHGELFAVLGLVSTIDCANAQ
jgi:hypothetical protein